jgi:hypothetical protein
VLYILTASQNKPRKEENRNFSPISTIPFGDDLFGFVEDSETNFLTAFLPLKAQW